VAALEPLGLADRLCRGIEAEPTTFRRAVGLRQVYFRLERYEKAIEYWRRALRVNPNMPGVELNIEAVQQLLQEKKARSI
jgi:tetratricopeptide (TPR) repeat protein